MKATEQYFPVVLLLWRTRRFYLLSLWMYRDTEGSVLLCITVPKQTISYTPVVSRPLKTEL